MDSTAVDEALTLLRAGVDGLLEARLDAVSGLDLVRVLEGLETQRRRLDAVDVRAIAEADTRRVAGEFGRTSTLDLLAYNLRVTPHEAKARVDRARDLGPRCAVSGEVLGPVLPATAAAVTAGVVSGAHASVIEAAMRRVDDLPDATVVAPVAEQFLVDAAGHEDPNALRRTARVLLDRLNPDGVEPREEELHKRRRFTLAKPGDGSAIARGLWTGQCAAVWEAILDALAAPLPAADGARDDRTAAQRCHDAMLEAGLRLIRSGTLPATGGTPVTVLVRTTEHDLHTPTHTPSGDGGLGQTEHGDLVSLASLVCCGGDAAITEIMLGQCGEALNHGRTRRCGTPAQRRVLAVRDGGCCFPGCTRPAAWTEVHHVKAWLKDHGRTDIDNLCLLCAHHHRQIGRNDWTLIMTDGIPHWIKPPWHDPQQRPIRNRAHHLPDIDFGDIQRWLTESNDSG